MRKDEIMSKQYWDNPDIQICTKCILFFEKNGETKFYLSEDITDLLTEEERTSIINGTGGTLPSNFKERIKDNARDII